MRDKALLRNPGDVTVIDVSSNFPETNTMTTPQAGEIMSKDVVVISPEDTTVLAAKLMTDNDISCLIVLDKGDVAGILTEADLLDRVISSEREGFENIRVAEIMTAQVISKPPQTSVFEANATMKEHQIKRLPIVDKGQLVGIVTQTDLLRVLTSHGMWKDVANIMNRDVFKLQGSTIVSKAAKAMISQNISCVVALDGDDVQGILTEKDLLKRVIVTQKDPTKIRINEVMSAPVKSVPPNYSAFSAGKMMEKNHVHRLVVMENNELCGIVTQTDIFRTIRDKLQEDDEKNLRLREKSENAIFTISANGTITYANRAFMNLFEVSELNDLQHQPFLPERFWLNIDQRPELLAELLNTDIDIKELTLKTDKGNRIFVILSSSRTKGPQGEVAGIQGTLWDITEKKELAALKEAQEDLWASEKRYRVLAENITDVIWTTDLNMHVTYVSPSTYRLWGYRSEEIGHQNMKDYMAPASLENLNNILAEELAIEHTGQADQKRCRQAEVELYHKDGSSIWVEMNMTLLRNEEGEALGILGVARDITERKKTSAHLLESEEKYATLVELSPDGIVLFQDNKIIFANRNFYELFGIKESDILEKDVMQLLSQEWVKNMISTLSEDDLQRIMKKITGGAKSKAPSYSWEALLNRKGSGPIWAYVTVNAIEYQGRPAQISVMRDISEQRKTREALNLTDSRLTSMFEAIQDVYFRLDPWNMTIAEINPAGAKLLGYESSDAIIGQSILNIFEDPDSLMQMIADEIRNVSEGRSPGKLEASIRLQDGSALIVDVSPHLTMNETSEVIGIDGIIRNITDRKNLETQLNESVTRLKASQEALSTPVVQIWDKVLVLPLIGFVDTNRAQSIMETLLSKITEAQSEMVILDITGVDSVDTSVADHLIKTIQAVKLLGAECVITGIKPEIAQAMIHLGLNLESFPTRKNLQDGLLYGLTKMGYTVRH